MEFKYSEQEWTRIENAIRRVRQGAIWSSEKRRIRTAAELFHHEDRTFFLRARYKIFQKRWLRIASLTEDLQRAIGEALPRPEIAPTEIKKALPILARLKKHCVERLGWESPFDQETNRQIFDRKILAMWTDHIGGKLSAPRSSAPLVEFFLAVANPVLKKPLAPSSIKKIVDQEKKRRKSEKSDG